MPHPEGIAADARGNVYVNDGRIVEISRDGTIVRIISLHFGPTGIKFVGVAPDGTIIAAWLAPPTQKQMSWRNPIIHTASSPSGIDSALVLQRRP